MLFFLSLFLFLSEAVASSEVSVDLSAHVDSELNIERIDNKGTLNILERPESLFRVTSNSDKNIEISFFSQNNWKLIRKDCSSVFIPYEGIFKSRCLNSTINSNSSSIEIKQEDFYDQEFEFRVVFHITEAIKNISAGSYSDCITISVTIVE